MDFELKDPRTIEMAQFRYLENGNFCILRVEKDERPQNVASMQTTGDALAT